MEKLSKAGKRWLMKEDEELMREVSTNESFEEIGKKHGRSAGAIESRLKVHARRLHKENKTLEEIEEMTKLSKYEIGRAINTNDEKLCLETLEKRIERLENVVEIILETLMN